MNSKTRTLWAGVLTGQVAGLIMAAAAMLVFAVFLGKSPLYPVQVIGSALLGAPALDGLNWSAVLVGVLLHQLGPSLLWGALFGVLAARLTIQTAPAALVLGAGVGILSMLGPYVLIPAAMHALQGVDYWNREVPMTWDWAAHLVFGASFVLFPGIRTKLGYTDWNHGPAPARSTHAARPA